MRRSVLLITEESFAFISAIMRAHSGFLFCLSACVNYHHHNQGKFFFVNAQLMAMIARERERLTDRHTGEIAQRHAIVRTHLPKQISMFRGGWRRDRLMKSLHTCASATRFNHSSSSTANALK
jgi:hypothetical protein